MDRQTLRLLAPWAALAALFAIALLALSRALPCWMPLTIDLAGLAGMICLAVPAVRINEEGRLIAQVRSLRSGIDELEAQLRSDSRIGFDTRARQEATLEERKATLEAILQELVDGKGAWTPFVNRMLYLGYSLLLGAAVARVVINV